MGQHYTIIQRLKIEQGKRKEHIDSRAVCSCGWISQWQDSEDDAENEATDHIVAVTSFEV